MNSANPNVDGYFISGCGRCSLFSTPKCKAIRHSNQLVELRRIVLNSELIEELKWKMPCYTINGHNVLMVTAFKEYTSINFFKGSVMADPYGLLVQPTENTQAGRQLRFTSPQQIISQEPIIREYIEEAIRAERSGIKIETRKTDFNLPDELLQKFAENPQLKLAFEALTPGRQRGYFFFFSAPKQSATRVARIEKLTPKIMAGKGFDE